MVFQLKFDFYTYDWEDTLTDGSSKQTNFLSMKLLLQIF